MPRVFFFVLAETSFQNCPGGALECWGYRWAIHVLQPAAFAMNVGDVTALGIGGWVASEDVGFETLCVYVCTLHMFGKYLGFEALHWGACANLPRLSSLEASWIPVGAWGVCRV